MTSPTTNQSGTLNSKTKLLPNNGSQSVDSTSTSADSDDAFIETPLPWRQVGILLAVRFSEPIGFTLLFPFIIFMVQDFNLTKDKSEVAYYAGLISSSFAISQVFSGLPWGMLSDRIGRRPVILMGLMGSSVSLFLFGLSKSLSWAIFTRSMCGLLNGNIGVLKSMMAELTDSTNRARGFSLLPMIYGLGTVIGPILGGYLSKPVTSYPWMFKDNIIKEFLLEYPYFLPCFVSSLLCFGGFLVGLFYLEESVDCDPKESLPISQSHESSPLLSDVSIENSKPIPASSSTDFAASNTNYSKPANILPVPIVESGTPEMKQSIITKGSWMAIFGFMGLQFQAVMLNELIPFWASSPVDNGGQDFKPPQIGLLVAFGGVSLLLIQLLLYPKLQQRFGTLSLYHNVYLFLIPLIPFYPLASFVTLLDSSFLLWAYLLTITVWRTGCTCFARTSINILLAETCPNKKSLGKVNGLSQVFGSLSNAVGPFLTGIAYSWSMKNIGGFILFSYPFTWILVMLALIACHYLSLLVTPSDLIFS